MKLSFRKSGGFAPVFMGCIFDTDAKPEPELEALVKSSKIMEQTSKKHPSARDVFYFTFTIDMNGTNKSVTFDQLNVPQEVEPLLNYLLERSTNMLPE